MNSRSVLLPVLVVLSAPPASLAQGAAQTAEEVILAQDLKKLRAPGKIGAALWTRRVDTCTLQLVRDTGDASRVVRTSQPAAQKAPIELQVWVLRADGTLIPWLQRWESPDFDNREIRGRRSGPEVNFSFPLSACNDAAAAAVMIDGEYFVDRIGKFTGPAN